MNGFSPVRIKNRIGSRMLLQTSQFRQFFLGGRPIESRDRKAWPKMEIVFHRNFVSKSHFGSRHSFVRAAWLSPKLRGAMRLGDNKIRISGALRAAVTGFGAAEPPIIEGVALPKFAGRGSYSFKKLVIRRVAV